jgi:hypothetical protein
MPLLVLLISFLVAAQTAAVPAGKEKTPQQKRVLLAAVRTLNHVNLSSNDKFEEAVSRIEAYLRANGVVVAEDPVRKQVRLEGSVPRATLLNIGEDAGADYVLQITVDRPVTSLISLSAECADAHGNVLWEERGSTPISLTSAGHVEKGVGKLAEGLGQHLGGPCLPLPVAAEGEDSPPHVRVLREGTLVKLKLAQTVSTRTAHDGDFVELAVADDVLVDGATVIHQGARAVGHIAEREPGEGGKGGQLQLTLDAIRCHGRTVKIRGVETNVEERKVAGVSVPFGLTGLLLPSQMAEGTPVHAVIAADAELPVIEVAKPMPQPPRQAN